MTQTRDLIKKMAEFFKSEEYFEKGEDARLELSPEDVRCMKRLIYTVNLVNSSSENPNKWIPVETALPEVGSKVLVCYEFKKHRSVYIANFYGDGEFHGLDDEYLTTEGRKYRKAVAWMPLPTPLNKSEIPTVAEGSEE